VGRKTPKKVIFWTIGIHFGALTFPNPCFCCYRVFLSTFSYAFYPRPESATFLFATVLLDGLYLFILLRNKATVSYKHNAKRFCREERPSLRCEYTGQVCHLACVEFAETTIGHRLDVDAMMQLHQQSKGVQPRDYQSRVYR